MNHLAALVSPSGSRSVQRDQLIAGARRDQVVRDAAASPSVTPSTAPTETWRDSTAFRVAMFASSVGAMPKGRFVVEKPPHITPMENGDKDYDTPCTVCSEKPTMHPTGLCGPCCTGESETYGGNW